MEGAAKLITSIGVLLGAILWPLVAISTLFVFRNEIKALLVKAPLLLDRVKALKLAGVTAELGEVAKEVAGQVEPGSGQITERQIQAAATIDVQSRDLSKEALRRQLDQLAAEHDTVRRTMPSGHRRTQMLTRILVQMRALGPALSGFIDSFKASSSPGGRLAAVAMMQMDPDNADLGWLVDRFSMDNPFIFYHASLALQNVANGQSGEKFASVKKAAETALWTVKSFNGTPDQSTIEVLEALISDRNSGHYS